MHNHLNREKLPNILTSYFLEYFFNFCWLCMREIIL
jgi:hypothetical protein